MRAGIFVTGTAAGPMDIVDSIVHGRRGRVTSRRLYCNLTTGSRNQLPKTKPGKERGPCLRKYRPIQTPRIEPRIGVYVCNCGGNIGNVVQCDNGRPASWGNCPTWSPPTATCSCVPIPGKN
ncbi:MAG: hypothetical protein MZV63_72150 [Marinilabiliales bacterium]|nr:hypothetical protein [Marinilabiliales bacterium]